MNDEIELLRDYVRTGSQDAFSTLVRRRIDLVYATAYRITNDPHLAEDVAQAVFTSLAQKAPLLVHHPMLGGWLHRCARYSAINARRQKKRQSQHVVDTHAMNETPAPAPDDGIWNEIRPLIDELLESLSARDRHALMLRFFDGCSFSEVGARLRLSEDAARMCVTRSLEKLRRLLRMRGLSSTPTALALALETRLALAAPDGLAASVSTAALATKPGALLAAWAAVSLNVTKVHVLLACLALAGIGIATRETITNHRRREEMTASGNAHDASTASDRTIHASLGQRPPELATVKTNSSAATVAEPVPALADSTSGGSVHPAHRVIATWTNAGRATPSDALETAFWAARNGDYQQIARMIRFTDEEAASMGKIFQGLSEPAQRLFGTPEFMYAAIAASGFLNLRELPPGGEVVEESYSGDDEAIVRYRVNGRPNVRTVPLHRVDGAWSLDVNMEIPPQMVPKFAAAAQAFADSALQRKPATGN